MDQRDIERALRGLPTTGLNRRQLMTMAAVLAAAAPLAGCGGDQRTKRTDTTAGKSGAKSTPAAVDNDRPENALYSFDEAKKLFDSLDWPGTDVPEPKSKVTVTLAITADENMEVRHAQFSKFFQERHPNIEIKREVTPFADFLQKYTTQAAGGSLPDLMYSHFSWGQNLIANNILTPLDDYIAKTPEFDLGSFTPTALTYWQKDGKLYGVPTDSGPILLFYNKAIFKQAGVELPDKSWTWEKVHQTAAKLASGTGAKKVFGYHPMPEPTADITTRYLLPYGGRFLSKDQTQVLIQEDAAQAALQPWVDLALKHEAVPSLAELQILENVNPFQANRAAMHLNGVWSVPFLLHLTGADRVDWGFTHVPSGPAGRFTPVIGSAFGMSSKAAQPEAAWILLNAFLSAAGHRFFLLVPPARLSTFERNLEALKIDDTYISDAKQSLQEFGTSDGVITLSSGQKIVDTAKPVWDRLRSGKLSLKEAVNQINERVTPVLKEK